MYNATYFGLNNKETRGQRRRRRRVSLRGERRNGDGSE